MNDDKNNPADMPEGDAEDVELPTVDDFDDDAMLIDESASTDDPQSRIAVESFLQILRNIIETQPAAATPPPGKVRHSAETIARELGCERNDLFGLAHIAKK